MQRAFNKASCARELRTPRNILLPRGSKPKITYSVPLKRSLLNDLDDQPEQQYAGKSS